MKIQRFENNNYNRNFATTWTQGTNKVISFGNRKLAVAERALKELEKHAVNGTPIDSKDEKWIQSLRKLFGSKKITIDNPNNPKEVMDVNCELTADKINNGNGVLSLMNAIKVMIAATKYAPHKLSTNGVTYYVHNRALTDLLKSKYNQEDFSKLSGYLNKKHVFDMTDKGSYGLIIDKERGIAKTCGATENWEMSDRAWITDIMRVGDIQKRKRPETWTKALNTIGEYYSTQAEQFERLINTPKLYREGDAMQGIPHIFMPKTLTPDKDWFNNKRLESHGLALHELCLGIIDGIIKGKSYGYKSSKDIPNDIIKAIDNLSKYFKAIDYPTAPSAGNWEEIPLKGGLTSDTEAIRSGLNAYRDLLYNERYSNNPEIQNIRSRINDLKPLSNEELTILVRKGQERVRATYLEEAPGIRPHDSSLVFITTSDIKLSDNVLDDVLKHTEILDSLEQNLVRENGIIRYSPFNFTLKDGTVVKSPDSYLNLNYFTAIDKDGKLNLDWKNILDQYASKDCSEPNMFFARAKLSTPNREAQWFMVSEMSTGYGKQIEKLVLNAKREKRELNQNEVKLIKKLKQKQAEYLNRALSRISDENPNKINQIKANGLQMPSVTVSEAHQYVTDVNGKPKMLQGTNAPLAWALSSLYKAMRQEALTIKMNV